MGTEATETQRESCNCIANIENDEIVIRVPIHALPDAAATAFDRHYGFDSKTFTVINPHRFALELLDELLREDEVGDTRVTRMLDAACVKLHEHGAEGLA